MKQNESFGTGGKIFFGTCKNAGIVQDEGIPISFLSWFLCQKHSPKTFVNRLFRRVSPVIRI